MPGRYSLVLPLVVDHVAAVRRGGAAVKRVEGAVALQESAQEGVRKLAAKVFPCFIMDLTVCCGMQS